MLISALRIDLDALKDNLEREATVGIIHNCEFIYQIMTLLYFIYWL